MLKEYIERKIDEVFDYKGVKLQVVEADDYYCNECYFNLNYACCTKPKNVDKCYNRSDGKKVIFKEL